MSKSEALSVLENMPEPEFQEFFVSLPYRVQLCCKGGLVNWHEVLPQWYISKMNLSNTVTGASEYPF